MINVSTLGVSKHGSHDQQSHAGGRGRGGGVNPFTGKPQAGGVNPFTGDKMSTNLNANGDYLTRNEDKKLNDLSVDMFNHKQNVPMSVRTGNLKSPSAQTHIKRGQEIVTQAHQIYGGTREQTMNELNRRIGS